MKPVSTAAPLIIVAIFINKVPFYEQVNLCTYFTKSYSVLQSSTTYKLHAIFDGLEYHSTKVQSTNR